MKQIDGFKQVWQVSRKILLSSLLSVVLLISLLSYCEAQTGSLPAIKVKGKDFVNAAGEVVRFQGVNFADPDKLVRDGQWNERFFKEAKNWGSNIIRLPVHPTTWRKRGAEEYLDILDKGVAWAKELGMYVIIDWHSIGNLNEEKWFRPNYVIQC
jgi:endoglucanase